MGRIDVTGWQKGNTEGEGQGVETFIWSSANQTFVAQGLSENLETLPVGPQNNC